jgi:hypothetical protein
MGKEKKDVQLGMNFCTASGRLKKNVLFKLVQTVGRDICIRCGTRIESPEELSFDHMIPWLDSEDPVGLFFDWENIGFSHLKCNIGDSRRPRKYKDVEAKIAARRIRRAAHMRKVYTPERRRSKYLTTGH